MSSRKTWIWIIGGVAATGIIGLVGVAGAGMYFVSRHVQSQTTTASEALAAFETATSAFKGRRPLYELNTNDEPVLTTPYASLPSAEPQPSELYIQAWIPEDQRFIRVSMPFWILRLGHRKVRVTRDQHGFDFEQLNLDVDQLERIGPALIFDFRNQDGVRVLLWTK